MTTQPLNEADLDALRKITSPTVCNAIETLDLRPRSEGFMGPEINCIFPDLGPFVAYACTAIISARMPDRKKPRASVSELWEHVDSSPGPKILVIQDMDYPNPIGSFWGEVNSNIFRALGCLGTVTNGGVRDLPEMERIGFHTFASCVLVSHSYHHLIDVGVPVEVGGLVVNPGDLLHGDEHGSTNIPIEVARDLPKVARNVEERERKIIDFCNSPGFTLASFRAHMTGGR